MDERQARIAEAEASIAAIYQASIRRHAFEWAARSRAEKGALRLKWFLAVALAPEHGHPGYLAEVGQYACMEGLRQRGLVKVVEVDHKHGRRLVTLTEKGRIRYEELVDLVGRPSQ